MRKLWYRRTVGKLDVGRCLAGDLRLARIEMRVDYNENTPSEREKKEEEEKFCGPLDRVDCQSSSFLPRSVFAIPDELRPGNRVDKPEVFIRITNANHVHAEEGTTSRNKYASPSNMINRAAGAVEASAACGTRSSRRFPIRKIVKRLVRKIKESQKRAKLRNKIIG